MTISDQYAEFKGAKRETIRRIDFEDGRYGLAFLNPLGHAKISMFRPKRDGDRFDGTFTLQKMPEPR